MFLAVLRVARARADREDPAVGATVVIYRGDNYKTQYDDELEKSGQSYGVTVEPNDDPLPGGQPSAAASPRKGSGQLGDDEDMPF
jgi:hypothetical protein